LEGLLRILETGKENFFTLTENRRCLHRGKKPSEPFLEKRRTAIGKEKGGRLQDGCCGLSKGIAEIGKEKTSINQVGADFRKGCSAKKWECRGGGEKRKRKNGGVMTPGLSCIS